MDSSPSTKLRKALDRIDRPGSFCVHGSVAALLPGLEVKKLGPVALPLTGQQAAELKKHCKQAPYGKGTETLVDTSVRRVWRMEPGQFRLSNPEWDAFLRGIVARVQDGLGLEKQKLEAHLYDLLLYEPGGFFLPHQDGEKLERMVGTLVIVLPSKHQGGALIVRHDGREEVVDFSDGSPHQIHYAAFYADCEHEIRPLRQGHRLCLVYNLTLAKGKKGLRAPRAAEHVEEIVGLLRDWPKDAAAQKLVVTLDHEYSQKGLAWDALKGVDRALASILDEAARQAGWHTYLGLLTLHESGSAEGGYEEDYYHRRGSWHNDDDDEDDAAETSGYEMGEVYESSLTVENARDRAGQCLPVAEMDVDEKELLYPDALRGVDPEEEFEGYTGNAGMTLDHWYRHAALLLWPECDYYEILCDQNPQAAVPVLKKLVAGWRKAGKNAAADLHADCIRLAKAILGHWRENSYGLQYREPQSDQLFGLLDALDDPALLETYLKTMMSKDLSLDPGPALAVAGQKRGWLTLAAPLHELVRNATAAGLPRDIRVLKHLASVRPRRADGWSELCRQLAADIVAALQRIDSAKKTDWHMRNLDHKAMLPDLVQALAAAGQQELLAELVDHMQAYPEAYELTAVQLAAIAGLRPWFKKNVKAPSAGLARWLASCRGQLEGLTAEEPKKPTDLRRPPAAQCKCDLCRELNRYLASPVEAVHRFSASQDRRSHLENEIRHRACDVDCTTERTSRPHTLVCTKNTNSYKAALKKYHQDLEQLTMVREIEAALPSAQG